MCIRLTLLIVGLLSLKVNHNAPTKKESKNYVLLHLQKKSDLDPIVIAFFVRIGLSYSGNFLTLRYLTKVYIIQILI